MADTETVRPAVSSGINHLVLCVRDIEASERFYTEGLGWERCGALKPEFGFVMRFYRASPTHHHHLALMQIKDPSTEPPVRKWDLGTAQSAINHYAVTYPTRDAFLQQLTYMKSKGIEFAVRGDHGMTHSAYVVDPDGVGVEILYEVPAEAWEGDVDAALNYFVPTATDGPETFVDNTDYVRFGANA
jgi:catechol 2,3-dioxygenase